MSSQYFAERHGEHVYSFDSECLNHRTGSSRPIVHRLATKLKLEVTSQTPERGSRGPCKGPDAPPWTGGGLLGWSRKGTVSYRAISPIEGGILFRGVLNHRVLLLELIITTETQTDLPRKPEPVQQTPTSLTLPEGVIVDTVPGVPENRRFSERVRTGEGVCKRYRYIYIYR